MSSDFEQFMQNCWNGLSYIGLAVMLTIVVLAVFVGIVSWCERSDDRERERRKSNKR